MIDRDAGSQDRRCSTRVGINEFVELRAEQCPGGAKALAVNLSASGLAVSHVVVGSVGERLRCKLSFTPTAPLSMDCRVVWAREASDELDAGMGLRFEDVTDTRQERLTTYITRLAVQTGETAFPIDPFCESGTWTPESLPALAESDGPELSAPPNPRAEANPGRSAERSSRAILFAGVLAIAALLIFLLAL